MAHEWGKAFLACGRAGLRGFSQQNFTPYSHKILTHAGHMVTLVGGLERFSGEQLEKLNDEMKKGHLRRSNCQNIDISLMVQKRREIALMHFDLKKKSRDEGRIPKHSCQHPYQAYGARVMAQQRREEEEEATRQATIAFQVPPSCCPRQSWGRNCRTEQGKVSITRSIWNFITRSMSFSSCHPPLDHQSPYFVLLLVRHPHSLTFPLLLRDKTPYNWTSSL